MSKEQDDIQELLDKIAKPRPSLLRALGALFITACVWIIVFGGLFLLAALVIKGLVGLL